MGKYTVLCLCSMLMMSTSLYAEKTQLLAIDYKKAINGLAEVNFSMSASAEYNAFLLKNPDRLVIDFSNTKLIENPPFSTNIAPYFERMRSALRNKQDLRVVFDFKSEIAPAGFTLDKDKADEKKIILSLFINQNSGRIKQASTRKFRRDSAIKSSSYAKKSNKPKDDLFSKQAKLLSIEYGKTLNEHVEVSFLISASARYNAFLLKSPDRLVMNFRNTKLIEKFSFPDAHPSFKKIRTGLRNKRDLRVVFDFKSGITPASFALNRDKLDKKRLILSLSINQTSNQVQQDNIKKTEEDPVSESYVKVDDNESDDVEKDLFSDWELSGKISFEELGFFHNGLDSRQHNNYVSGAIEPEIYREWDNGKQSFTFVPFYRYSQHDNRRTHFDIRELTWLLAKNDWELRVGFRKVFWGVAEGLHLVDIVNQTDLVENSDTEDKLGQPMINLAIIRDWGTIDLFFLPGFRERTFPGVEGRMRSFPEVDVGDAMYEKNGAKRHLAYAGRWSHAIGDWDFGFSHFYGTSREPSFRLNVEADGSLELTPYYELINQTGLEVQMTHEDWILKHEAIVRSGQGNNTFYASTTGIEYTFFDLFSSGLDLGLVVEYMYDTRGSGNALAPFQDDILTALRFGFNDVQSTEILAGVFFDRTNNTRFYNVEASRRLGDSFTIDVEMRIFSGAPATDPAYAFREDDHVRVELGYHF